MNSNNKIANYSIGLIVLLYCVCLSSYLQAYINQVAIQITIYMIATILFVFQSNKLPQQTNKGDIFWPLLYIYLCLLLIRLLIDYIIPGEGMFLYKHPLTVLFFYIFPILIPTIFFSKTQFTFDVKKTIWIISIMLFMALTASYLAIIGGSVEKTIDQRYNSGFGVFSIEYGHLGTSLILITIYLIGLYGLKSFRTLIFGAYIFIGFMSIAFSGSRGPFIALIACLAFWYVSRSKNGWKLVCLIIVLILAGSLLKDFLYGVNDLLAESGIHTFERILNTVFSEDGLSQHTSGRNDLYTEGWALFVDNPIVGHSLFIPGKIYVHNIFLEQFMALGIFGGTAFVILNIIALYRSFKLIRHNYSFSIVPILFVQNLIFGSLSCTIISLPAYWLFLLVSMNKYDFVKSINRFSLVK